MHFIDLIQNKSFCVTVFEKIKEFPIKFVSLLSVSYGE